MGKLHDPGSGWKLKGQDLTPAVVEDFLPVGTLANVPLPIHIPLDRYDGRTKDYMVSL